jgi:hypothetical protein
MSETSETKDRVRVVDGQLVFDDDVLISKYHLHGNAYYTLHADVLDKLNTALAQPVPSGVLLTHWERVEIERSAICMEGMTRDPVFGEDYAKRAAVFRDLLARSAQSGEVVAVRREVLEALHDCTGFLAYPPNEATRKLFAEAEAALAATKGE